GEATLGLAVVVGLAVGVGVAGAAAVRESRAIGHEGAGAARGFGWAVAIGRAGPRLVLEVSLVAADRHEEPHHGEPRAPRHSRSYSLAPRVRAKSTRKNSSKSARSRASSGARPA